MFMSFAPMEGVTGAAYRRIHRQMFPGADRYYAPFVSPDTAGTVKRSQLEALRRDEDPEFPLVPQILANNAASFLAAARRLADLGYGEINLNLGCPSGTVAAKHKGAGLLADADALRRLLDGIFAQPPAAVSVKTRMGWASTAEFPALLEIFRLDMDRFTVGHLPGIHRIVVIDTILADVYGRPLFLDFLWHMNGNLCGTDRCLPVRRQYVDIHIIARLIPVVPEDHGVPVPELVLAIDVSVAGTHLQNVVPVLLIGLHRIR